MNNNANESLNKHYEWKGKIEITPRVPLGGIGDLALAYTPGVAAPCLEIQRDPSLSFELTRRWNTVAVVTDGTAVLGLGDIGPTAAMPVMEGKAALFKAFGGVDAIPLCVNAKDDDDFVNIVAALEPNFGGINLEDIAAPRCFDIERKLAERLSIPVFHDDQHGTAIVVLAAALNALRLTNKRADGVKVVVNGAGAAGTAIINLMIKAGFSDITACDKNGAIYRGKAGLSAAHAALAATTNPRNVQGDLADAMVGADIFIGVSAPNCVTAKMVSAMAERAAVFALANPTPEIMPDEAAAGGAFIVGTGRSDFPNQINNVLAFPGVFRGALDARVRVITGEMKLAAADAIARQISDGELAADNILPKAFDRRVTDAVAAAIQKS